jgi:cytochrome c oxidase subunit III
MSSLIKTLASKPWLTGADDFGSPVDVRTFDTADEKIGLRAFFFVAGSLFLLFIVGYRLRMVYEDWVPIQEPFTLWVNTVFLIIGSVALELSRRSLKADNTAKGRQWFYVGGACSLLFLTGQLAAWQQLALAGQFVASNPSASFFYLLTGVHGLHILGGLVAWAKALPRLQPGADTEQAKLSVDLCAVYWHFLLVIWVVLFYLLLAS